MKVSMLILSLLIPAFAGAQSLAYEGLSGTRADSWIDNNWTAIDSLRIEYNEAQLPVTMTTLLYEDGKWLHNRRQISTYDTAGKRDTYTVQGWKDDDWQNLYRELYSYDEAGNQTMRTEQSRQSGEWINQIRIVQQYDENGLLAGALRQEWLENLWEDRILYSYGYNELQQQTEFISELVMGSHRELVLRTTYAYDSLERLIQKTEYYHPSPAVGWIADYQEVYSYNEDSRLVQTLVQVWEVDNWMDFSQHLQYYDEYGNDTLSIKQSWGGDRWYNKSLFRYGYDERHNQIYAEHQEGQDSLWINKRLQLYDFNENNVPIRSLSFFWQNEEWANGVRTFYYYDVVSGLFTPVRSEIPVSIYPNPNKGQFQIAFPVATPASVRLIVYDANGRVVYQSIIGPGAELAPVVLPDVPAGMYQVYLRSGEATTGQPVIIRR